ncbi:MAG: isocitrate lyase/PEP mutase family protein [Nitrospira sp.]|nr:isocitrate lyase/PEP mutase family protein [Nitrospira sp.]HBP88787.1 carboxyvinyl-carboxyphosphonate phosphorylmutase [Nitrospiraceae bacterium]HNP27626.1 isocitrate lyase/PEP mutase family protein [Nitrospirales bacterium]
MRQRHGKLLKEEIWQGSVLPFIGVYDVFSASIAAQYFNGLFLSGFSFAASYYGLPDIGFICWSDLVAFTQRVRTVLPQHHLLIDIDDGFGDSEIASHVVSLLEETGASGVIMEDQKRPRRCGHFPGKQLLEIEEYLLKLTRVLETRKDIVVIARTDAMDPEDRLRRAKAFSDCGADAVLVEALPDLAMAREVRDKVKCPIMVNQIVGGKSPSWSFRELQEGGVSLVNYSTPCLFGAQSGMERTLTLLKDHDGKLPNERIVQSPLEFCTNLLYDNMKRRDNQ